MQTSILFVFLLIFVSSEFIIAVQIFSGKFNNVRQCSFLAILLGKESSLLFPEISRNLSFLFDVSQLAPFCPVKRA